MIYETMEEWRQCRDAMLPAIAMTNGTHTEDDVLALILSGRMKLWRSGTSGIVTEFIEFPRLKALNYFLCGGKLDELLPLKPALDKYSIQNGCTKQMALFARKGWERFFGDEFKIIGTCAHREF